MHALSLVASALFGILLFITAVNASPREGTTKEISTHPNIDLINKDICGIAPKRSSGPLFQVPWMALLVYNTSRGIIHSCGGTVISERYVLTSTNCVKNLPKFTVLVGVRLGEYDYSEHVDCERVDGQVTCADPPLDAGIEKIIPHVGYNLKSFRHNIALLRLNKTIDFTSDSVRPICLPISSKEQQRYFHEGELLTVVGWGQSTSTGIKSTVVRPVHVEFVPTATCAAAYRNFTTRIHIFEDQMCMRGSSKGDATAGDGGGPLLAGGFETLERVTQYGIVSFGPSSGLNPPGVYTHVGSYMKWILDHMEPSDVERP